MPCPSFSGHNIGARELKHIFSHNNIRFIESDTFEWGPEKLEILHLDHNYMEVIEQDLFSGKVSFWVGFGFGFDPLNKFITEKNGDVSQSMKK